MGLFNSIYEFDFLSEKKKGGGSNETFRFCIGRENFIKIPFFCRKHCFLQKQCITLVINSKRRYWQRKQRVSLFSLTLSLSVFSFLMPCLLSCPASSCPSMLVLLCVYVSLYVRLTTIASNQVRPRHNYIDMQNHKNQYDDRNVLSCLVPYYLVLSCLSCLGNKQEEPC